MATKRGRLLVCWMAVLLLMGNVATMGIEYPSSAERWGVFEIVLTGPSSGNPYVDVTLGATFTRSGVTRTVTGFYDGGSTYRIRFMPDAVGTWSFTTSSSNAGLNGQTGSFACTAAAAGNHGPMRVRDSYHFQYEDGTPFFQVGTTSYNWMNQTATLQAQTLQTLSQNGFNKMRCLIMPKYYDFNTEPPAIWPYEGSPGAWNFDRPIYAFFQNHDQRVRQLRDMGIEADIIICNAYDGPFGLMSIKNNQAQMDRYVKYLLARFSAYRNVWWSMSNEYQLWSTNDSYWDALFQLVRDNDPYGHLRSIHNMWQIYDHTKPWVTHASLQEQPPDKTPINFMMNMSRDLRAQYGKPIVWDEVRYEGNLPTNPDYFWGRMTPEEMTMKFWVGTVHGVYVGHSETYMHPQNIIWWGKGGVLYGGSPARIAFLRQLVEQHVPGRKLEPVAGDTTAAHNGTACYLYYYGTSTASSRTFSLPPGIQYRAYVVDTWNMTKTDAGLHAGSFTLGMPGNPYMAALFVQEGTVTPPSETFVKGINFNGGAVTIDGNLWSSYSAALGSGLSVSPAPSLWSGSVTPSPAVGTDGHAMLNSVIWRAAPGFGFNQTLANGSYNVYLWVMENYQSNVRSFAVQLEGATVASSIGTQAYGTWVKYGPYAATVSDGALSVNLVSNYEAPHVSGIAIYSTETATPSPVTIANPYAGVNWSTYGQHKANFHAHTTESDGSGTPAQMIDAYDSRGYSVLALTDHDEYTWSWEDYGRTPSALGMIAIPGCEASKHHHMGSLFNDYNGSSSDIAVSLQTVGTRNGLAVLFHPGRYSYSMSWYTNLYTTYDHLIGMEVHNKGDLYPNDRALWDQVLTELMPGKPVWGFADDDAHNAASDVARDWNTFILPELTETALRNAMVNGQFYFSYAPTGGNPAPVINSIATDEQAGTISIGASGCTSISWISGGTVVGSGTVLDVSTLNGYVRAELTGPTGKSYTQPFFVTSQAGGGPAGYAWCADEGDTFALPGTCDVAYGANGSYHYLYNRTGSITFNNATFGDPIPGVAKKGYYKTVAAPGFGWEFNTAGNLEGWTAQNHVTGLAVSGGSLGGTITGTDPYLHTPTFSQAASLNQVTVRLQNGTASAAGKLYFLTSTDGSWNEAKSKQITIQANSGFVDYVFDMSTVAGWAGTITRLRLDPANATGSFNVDYVRIGGASGGGTVATPTISPNGGTFTDAVSVALACGTSGASIRYTTDGSTPSPTSGTVYSAAFNVTQSCTVKAIAYLSGMADSGVASAAFTVNASGGTFVKGINFNGGAVTIDGNVWTSYGAALSSGLSVSPSPTLWSGSVTPSPSVGADGYAMLNSAIWHPAPGFGFSQTIGNGSYDVYLWVMENYQSNTRSFAVQVEGTTVASAIGTQTLGAWLKYGPYPASVADGALSVNLVSNYEAPHVMGMAIFTAAAGGAPALSWEFDTAGNTEGWTAQNQISGLGASGGSLNGTITGNDPHMLSGTFSQDASAHQVTVRLKNSTASTSAQVFFTTSADGSWNEAKSKSVAVAANSDFADYTFDMSTVSGWAGTITRLRLDPAANATGSFQVDYIRVEEGQMQMMAFSQEPLVMSTFASRAVADGETDKVAGPTGRPFPNTGKALPEASALTSVPPADYDGDGFDDRATYHERSGTWRIWLSSREEAQVVITLGGLGAVPVVADYDGDGFADPAVYGETLGDWAIMLSSADGGILDLEGALGGVGYIACPADYDGDGRADPAVLSETGNDGLVRLSSLGYATLLLDVGTVEDPYQGGIRP